MFLAEWEKPHFSLPAATKQKPSRGCHIHGVSVLTIQSTAIQADLTWRMDDEWFETRKLFRGKMWKGSHRVKTTFEINSYNRLQNNVQLWDIPHSTCHSTTATKEFSEIEVLQERFRTHGYHRYSIWWTIYQILNKKLNTRYRWENMSLSNFDRQILCCAQLPMP